MHRLSSTGRIVRLSEVIVGPDLAEALAAFPPRRPPSQVPSQIGGQVPVSRETGQVPYQDFTSPITALIRD